MEKQKIIDLDSKLSGIAKKPKFCQNMEKISLFQGKDKKYQFLLYQKTIKNTIGQKSKALPN
jgi:hypothetical protein